MKPLTSKLLLALRHDSFAMSLARPVPSGVGADRRAARIPAIRRARRSRPTYQIRCVAALVLALLTGSITESRAQTYSINWFKVAGGGGASSGGVYTVTGTVGQPDAGGPMEGGGYAVEGGFWSLYDYAFKQVEEDQDEETDSQDTGVASTGWETMLEALLGSGLSVTGTWPIGTEQLNRMRAVGANALASSIVFVCRARTQLAPTISRRDYLTALKKELPEALRHLQKGNIAPVDLAQAAIGPGMAVFSRYARVLETDGSPMSVRTALTLINQSLDEVLAEQEGEFDADTRWAVAWFDQYGFTEGPYGAAETLCTAKNTSVPGMVEAGILTAKAGKVRLLKKEELPATWDPSKDKRLPIWEITHHLIRRLEQGESGAADLIRQLGVKAQVARDLSYRLYTICERRKWAADAIAYNTLVLSWSDVQRLAAEKKPAAPAQGELI